MLFRESGARQRDGYTIEPIQYAPAHGAIAHGAILHVSRVSWDIADCVAAAHDSVRYVPQV